MTSIQVLAAQAHVRAALLNLLIASTHDGSFVTAVCAEIALEDGDAFGSYQIGGIGRNKEFHALTGASL